MSDATRVRSNRAFFFIAGYNEYQPACYKKLKKCLTKRIFSVILAKQCSKNAGNEYRERYRSGHNEAVLKTVCPRGHVGSNPTLSVLFLAILWRSTQEAEGAPLERE